MVREQMRPVSAQDGICSGDELLVRVTTPETPTEQAMRKAALTTTEHLAVRQQHHAREDSSVPLVSAKAAAAHGSFRRREVISIEIGRASSRVRLCPYV